MLKLDKINKNSNLSPVKMQEILHQNFLMNINVFENKNILMLESLEDSEDHYNKYDEISK